MIISLFLSRIPVTDVDVNAEYLVYDHLGELLPTQINEIPEHIKNVPGESNADIVFPFWKIFLSNGPELKCPGLQWFLQNFGFIILLKAIERQNLFRKRKFSRAWINIFCSLSSTWIHNCLRGKISDEKLRNSDPDGSKLR